MIARRFRFALLAVGLLFLALPPLAAQPPADPLPQGAKLRLGTTRLRDPNRWNRATLSPDGEYLFTFHLTDPAWIEVATGDIAGKPLQVPEGVSRTPTHFSTSGKRAVTLTFNTAVVWETDTGKIVAKVDRRTNPAESSAAFSADGKILALGRMYDPQAKDKPVTVLVWDIEKNAGRSEVTVLQNRFANVTLSADGKCLATWGNHIDSATATNPEKDFGRVVQFWDATSGKELSRVQVVGYRASSVAFAPDGKTAAITDSAGTLLVDPQTGAVTRRLFGQRGAAARIAFSPDGKLLASIGERGTTQLWQVADGTLTATVPCPLNSLRITMTNPEIRFTSPNRAVAWGVAGTTAVVWEIPSGKLLSDIRGHLGPIVGLAFAAGGKELRTGGHEGRILRWDAASGKELGEITLHPPEGILSSARQFQSVVFGPGAETALVDGLGGQGIYDLGSGTERCTLPNSPGTRQLFGADARTLFLPPSTLVPRDQPKTIKVPIWDTTTGKKLAEPELPYGQVLAVAVTPDRTKAVTALITRPAKDDKNPRSELLVTGWDLTAEGKKLGELTAKRGVGDVHLTAAPDNKTVLLCGEEGRVLTVDLTTGKEIREFETEQQRSTAAVFSPDGKTFAVGLGSRFATTTPGIVRVYEVETGKHTRTYRGHHGPVTCLAFSPDGKTLASGSNDTTVLLWDLAIAGE